MDSGVVHHPESLTPSPPGSAFNSETAMQKAKRNVEKYYAVVGVLEEMNKTLAVLEHYSPRFFAGAAEIYQGEAQCVNRCLRWSPW